MNGWLDLEVISIFLLFFFLFPFLCCLNLVILGANVLIAWRLIFVFFNPCWLLRNWLWYSNVEIYPLFVLIKILMFWVYLFLVVCCCGLMKFSVGLRVGRTFHIWGWGVEYISDFLYRWVLQLFAVSNSSTDVSTDVLWLHEPSSNQLLSFDEKDVARITVK